MNVNIQEMKDETEAFPFRTESRCHIPEIYRRNMVVPPMNEHGTAVCMEFEFDASSLHTHWERLTDNTFAAESCFFNCQRDDDKDGVLEYLDDAESAMTDYAQCVLEWLHTIKFVEKSSPVPPLPARSFWNNNNKAHSRAFESHPVHRIRHVDIVAQIEEFESSQNMAVLVGLKHKIEIMKEFVRIYVESNRVNTEKYIIDEHDPHYTCYPAWMFFPFVK